MWLILIALSLWVILQEIQNISSNLRDKRYVGSALASNRQFRNKQTAAMVQEVCYVDVSVWGPQADNCRQYLQKGRPVLVEGRLNSIRGKMLKDSQSKDIRSLLIVLFS